MPAPESHRQQPPASPSRAFWDHSWCILLGCILISGLIWAAYHNTLQVPFLLDDFDSITKNPSIRSFATAFFPPTNSGVTVSGRPLLNFSLAINHRLGIEVSGYHIGNLIIHCAAALCLFGVVRRTLTQPIFGDRFRRHATILAWFTSALWALHPLQAESVTYVIQRAESLAGLCYLFTLYSFIRCLEKRSAIWSAVTVLSCLAGMAAKEIMVSAPLLLLIYDYIFVSKSLFESWRRRRYLYIALFSTWALLFTLVISSGGRGSSVGFKDVSWFDYLCTQGPGITTYLWHSIFPANLVFDYGAVIEQRVPIIVGGMLIVTVLFIASAVFLVKRRPLGFLGAWFFLILAPTSSVVPVATQTLAEHRMYLPLAALAVGTVLLVYYYIRNRYCWAILTGLLFILGFATERRNIIFQSSMSVWEDTVRKVPDNVRALNNLGLFYVQANRLDEAIQLLSNALDLAPSYPFASCNLGRALIGKAEEEAGIKIQTEDLVEGIDFGQKRTTLAALLANEKVKAGLDLLKKAIDTDPENPVFLSQYGNALLSLRQAEAAVAPLEAAVKADPENRDVHYDLANTYSRLDINEKAAEHFQIALRLKPDDANALTNYGSLLRRMGRLPESIEKLQTACKLNPMMARAHSNLGVSFLEGGRTDEGMQELKKALELDPNLPQARYNLSNALADAGQTDQAIIHLEALLKLAPPTAELVSNLGVLYARENRLEDALVQMHRALELDPNYEPASENLAKIDAYIRTHPIR